jgi:hypothetical protein
MSISSETVLTIKTPHGEITRTATTYEFNRGSGDEKELVKIAAAIKAGEFEIELVTRKTDVEVLDVPAYVAPQELKPAVRGSADELMQLRRLSERPPSEQVLPTSPSVGRDYDAGRTSHP